MPYMRSILQIGTVCAAALVLAGAVGFGWYIFDSHKVLSPSPSEQTNNTQQLQPVKVSGHVIFAETQNVATVERGVVEKILVKEGDSVKKGVLLARLESTPLEMALEHARAEREHELLELKQLTASIKNPDLLYQFSLLTQAQSLLSADRITPDVYDAIVGSSQQRIDVMLAQFGDDYLKVQRLMLKSADLQVKSAQLDLGHASFKAPFDGEVVALGAAQGSLVDPGHLIVTLARPDQIAVEVLVNEKDITRMKVGGKATVSISALADSSIEGTIRSIGVKEALSDEAGRALYRVVVLLSKVPSGLKSGMSAQVDFAL